ncbi:cytochrome c biogenesis protein DipZ [Zestomonas carbonaria]|uniref:Protein DipZ n=1 Tax=Zestomonas carbonaria TaxID=2762745 RepID=A0A7U7IBY6_9GAMM|nr:cytochrome c biogenesis protein DipZ [Pseudomonas carbonaria]CAD5109527.1 Protein DipZ [Pseudomonas carbonaria]
MILIAFLGGIITVLSPCILPVVPFLFAGAALPRRSIALTLGAMALTFALVSSLAVTSSAWVIQVSSAGRHLALAALGLFALALLSPRVGAWLTRPLVALGNRLERAGRTRSGATAAVLLGVATGLIWTPCAGPILGLIMTSAMLQGASVDTSLLLLAYALGSAVALGAVLLAGGRLLGHLKRWLPVTEWLRRAGGVVMLVAVAVIATGLDTRLLSRAPLGDTGRVEQILLDRLPGAAASAADYLIDRAEAEPAIELKQLGPVPSLSGAVEWINSPPLTREDLRGKVVLIDFWTYDCINCQRTLPHVNQWARKYASDGLVVIGVHTPEYAFEKVIDNVRREVRKLGIEYPVAIDNDYRIWRAFDNRYWPAHYFVDARGQVRYSHFGEGRYQEQERVIQQLLREANVPFEETIRVSPQP